MTQFQEANRMTRRSDCIDISHMQIVSLGIEIEDMKTRPEGDYHNRAHVLSLSTPTPAFCACCRRRAGHCGHGSLDKAALWACPQIENDDCFEAIYRIREMATPDFDELEHEALKEAGKLAAAYLKSIGATDAIREFGKLESDQIYEFLERIVDGFGSHLKFKLVLEHRPANQGQK